MLSGTAGASALDVASALLAEYGGLGEFGRALPEELARRRGVGRARAATLAAVFELARRLDGARPGTACSSSCWAEATDCGGSSRSRAALQTVLSGLKFGTGGTACETHSAGWRKTEALSGTACARVSASSARTSRPIAAGSPRGNCRFVV